MPRGKNTISKEKKVKKVESVKEVITEEESDDAAEGFAPKEKVIPVVLEVEERDDILTPIDKLVADPLRDAVSIEGTEPDDLIDEEEIDPFGDKWEA